MDVHLLNPYQKNSLEVSLRSFEQNLLLIQGWIDEKDRSGILSSRKNSLTQEQRQEIHQKVVAALAEIAYLKAELGLAAETENVTDSIRGLMSLDWEGLLNSQSSKLKRFGKVNPEVPAIVDPPIQFLANIALSLSSITAGDSSASDPRQNVSSSQT